MSTDSRWSAARLAADGGTLVVRAGSPQRRDQESDRDCRGRERDARRGGLWQRLLARFERSQSEFDGFTG